MNQVCTQIRAYFKLNHVDFCANKRKLHTHDFFPHFNQDLNEILTNLHFWFRCFIKQPFANYNKKIRYPPHQFNFIANFDAKIRHSMWIITRQQSKTTQSSRKHTRLSLFNLLKGNVKVFYNASIWGQWGQSKYIFLFERFISLFSHWHCVSSFWNYSKWHGNFFKITCLKMV